MRPKYAGPRTGWYGKLNGMLDSHHFTDGESAEYRRRLDLEYGSTILYRQITTTLAARTKAAKSTTNTCKGHHHHD